MKEKRDRNQVAVDKKEIEYRTQLSPTHQEIEEKTVTAVNLSFSFRTPSIS